VTTKNLLIVDDEPSLREMLSIFFRRSGFEVTAVPGVAAAKEAASHHAFPVVLTDLMMPDGSGMDLLRWLRENNAGSEVILMTAHSTVDTALEAMKAGAYDFVAKPFSNVELKLLVEKALEKRTLQLENHKLKATLAKERKTTLVGGGRAMRKLSDLIERAAPTKSTILITGESGTGKERIARAIHDASDRKAKPFLVVNCGAFPEALIEAELFGHEKGAFTGATQRRLGIFREAEGGTVFLDEVGELPLAMQVKLLRVLQERKVRGIGETHETAVDVRVLAATNRSPEDEVKAGRFRQDLFYRLNVIRIPVPALRERKSDIQDLLGHFLSRAGDEHGKEVRGFTPDALRAIEAYPFPGNVRELENLVERATALSLGPVIGLGAKTTPALAELGEGGCDLDAILAETERRLILQALERSGGVRTAAAKLLGVTFRSFRYRLAKLGLGEDGGDGDDPISGNS
jgi:two-component system, NtrC family, response regulator PilR